MLESEIFRKQMYCIDESACDIVGTFPRPRSDLAPGKLCFPFPLVAPLYVNTSDDETEMSYYQR